MSIFDKEPQAFVNFVHEGRRLKQDRDLLTAYSKQIEGVGVEALAENPAHQLIMRGLEARYGKHVQPGVGNEAIGLAIVGVAALATAGYVGFKKLMLAKNNPALKDIKVAEQKVNSTYTAAWLNGKESVGKEVSNGMISKLFEGKDFATVSKALEKYFNEVVTEFKKATADHIKLWKEIEPYIRRWNDEPDREKREGIVEQLRAKYGRDVWTEPCANIKLDKEDKKGSKLPALTKDEYGKAVALIKSLLAKATDVDELTEDVWHNVGLWDDFDKFGDDADAMWEWGYAEIVNDAHGHYGYRIHTQLIGIARGLEEWIIKSFK